MQEIVFQESVSGDSVPVISRCIELSMGSGRDRKLKGSKRALMCPHVLHFTWDLSWPWKRSTTMERFLRRWFSHACSGGDTQTQDVAGAYNGILAVSDSERPRLEPTANWKVGGSIPWARKLNPPKCASHCPLASCVAATMKRLKKCCLRQQYFPVWTRVEQPGGVNNPENL